MEKALVFFACLLVVVIAGCEEKPRKRALPFAGNYDLVTYEQDGKTGIDTVYPKIPAFKYLNQDSAWVTSRSMKGKIWIANFFFTSCPNICPPVISQMKRLNVLTSDIAEHLQFISFTIDPKVDKPHVLKSYVKNNGISTNNWQFLTGNEVETHRLGIDHFLIFAEKTPLAEGGFAHGDGLVLVDKEGYVRGIYRGTVTAQVDLLNRDLRKLLKIEYGIDCKQK